MAENGSWLRGGFGRDTKLEWIWDRWLVIALVVLTPLTLLGLIFYGAGSFDSTLGEGEQQQISFRVAQGPSHGWDPITAREVLRISPEVKSIATRLAEDPFYFSFDLRAIEKVDHLYLASGHAERISCWNQAGESLGSGNRSGRLDRVFRAGVGFVLPVREADKRTPILCEAAFRGPALAVAYALTSEQLRGTSDRYHRLFGALEGGMLMLVVFLLITGIVNREMVYAVFAVWVIANWRVTEQLLGTGADVFTLRLPGEWVVPTALLTLLLFLMANFALFITLFQDEIKRVDRFGLIRLARLIVVVEILLYLFAPFHVFVISVWAASGVGVIVLASLIVSMMKRERGGVATFYGLLLLFALIVSLYVVVSEVLGIKGFSSVVFGVINSVMASVMAILMLASKLQRATAQSRDLSRTLEERYEVAPLCLFTVTPDGVMKSSNAAFRALFGDEATAGVTWRSFLGREAWALLAVSAQKGDGSEIRLTVGEDGSLRHFGVRVKARSGLYDGAVRDITSDVETQQRQQYLEQHDALTGVLNAVGLDRATEALRRENPERHAYWMLAVDLERLSAINDLFGHEVGDKVLVAVAGRLKGALPERAAVSRVGGDQFLCVIPDGPADAMSLGQRAAQAVRGRNVEVSGVSVAIDANVGVTLWDASLTLKEAKTQAEYACRKARRDRVPVEVFDALDTAALAFRAARTVAGRMETMPGLRDLRLGVRPLIRSPDDSAAIGFEVVPLLPDARGTFVAEDAFMTGLELWGSMDVVDVWRVERAFTVLREAGARFTGLACVTLSGAVLSNAVSAKGVVTIIRSNIEFADRLLVRIPESAAMQDPDAAAAMIADLRKYRCVVVYCEVGAPNVTLSGIWQFDTDGIELSAAIVDGVKVGRAELEIAEAVQRAARKLGRWVAGSTTGRTPIGSWSGRYLRMVDAVELYDATRGLVTAANDAALG